MQRFLQDFTFTAHNTTDRQRQPMETFIYGRKFLSSIKSRMSDIDIRHSIVIHTHK